MRLTKKRRTISGILLILILFSCMCHEVVRADVSFLCMQSRKYTSTIDEVHDRLADQDAFVEEETSLQESNNREESFRGRYVRRIMRNVEAMISIAGILPGNPLLHPRKTDDGVYKENYSQTVITRYIHQKDGEKVNIL